MLTFYARRFKEGVGGRRLAPLLLLLVFGPLSPAQVVRGHQFYFRDLGHRCIQAGTKGAAVPGAVVNTYNCDQDVAEQISVMELDDGSHDVQLGVQRPSTTYSNGLILCIGVRGGKVTAGTQLELQQCSPGASSQRFALDGDTILMGSQSAGHVTREFAVRPQIDPTKAPHDKSGLIPLIVDLREVMDVEYFLFQAVDAPATYPTTGFVTVSNEAELRSALNLGWGTVIEVNPSQPLILNPECQSTPTGVTCNDYQLQAGVTLRGYRKHLTPGPMIYVCPSNTVAPPTNPYGAFDVAADDVRITGLRLYGALNKDKVCKQSKNPTLWDAILVCKPTPRPNQDAGPNPNCPASNFPRVVIDHTEIAYFAHSAIETLGPNHNQSDFENCPCPPFVDGRDTPVRVIGNLIHDNNGWASVNGWGAFVLNRANIMYGQGSEGDHAENIDSDGIGSSGYLAYDNFILSVHTSSAMDIHGTGCPNGAASQESPKCSSSWQGGISGDAFDIGWNTFLPTGGQVIVQRGTPCRATTVQHNVFLLSTIPAAISSYTIYPQDKLKLALNFFHVSDPTTDLGVGDFDGDGVADVFIGTGTAWYYSSGGQSEWRYLNRAEERASGLLFGDFDGDGRADVIALHGKNIDISWGGISPWQTINTTDAAFSDLAVGDFDGDGKSDLFVADGKSWFYAPGGGGAWTLLATSSYRTKDLLFGDFKKTGRTQALRILNGQWEVAGLGMPWTNIGASGTSSIKGLVVGHFNHDGYADVAGVRNGNWEYSAPVLGKWTTLRSDTRNMTAYSVGDFTGDGISDVVVWGGLLLDVVVSGIQEQPRSLQNMR